MSRKRKFSKLTEEQQVNKLFSCLISALSEPESSKIGWRTDVYEIACQYGGNWNVRREDFNQIRNMTIDEIVNKLTEK